MLKVGTHPAVSHYFNSNMSEMIEYLTGAAGADNVYMPRLIASALILLVGWLVATVARALFSKLMRFVLQIICRKYPLSAMSAARVQKLVVKLLPKIVYWFVILFAFTMVTETLKLPVFTAWLAQVVNYVPVFLTALLLILGGVWLGGILRETVSRAAAAARLPYAQILGGVCQSAIVIGGVVVALSQLGIDLSFITLILGIILASLLLAITLAFGLGANSMVGNIISCHYLHSLYRVGSLIEIDGTKGTIIKLTGAFVVIETESGQVAIPANLFTRSVSTQFNS